MPSEQTFEATVERAPNGRVFVRLPFDPSRVWGEKARHYVTGFVQGHRIRARLDSRDGTSLLSLGEAWRRDSGITTGAHVTITLAAEGPQQDNMSEDIASALAAEPAALALFDSLATFYRRNSVRWIESAKRPETRARRIQETIGHLKAGKRQR